ncbi:MAG: sigma-70 family RNA polymerase sigma factor [Chloroflexota bacterium]
MITSQMDTPEVSDEALVERIRGEDVRALDVLYSRYSRPVYSLALKMLGTSEAAEELVQETFLRLWQRPETYSAERGKISTWLLGVCHHRAVDVLRRRRLETRHLESVQAEAASLFAEDPADDVIASVQGERVIRALQELPDAQRLVVELAYIRGMSQSEIADATGEPLGTVKTRMRLAMQKLRTTLTVGDLRPGGC